MKNTLLCCTLFLIPSSLPAQRLLVANQADHTLLIIDPASRKTVATVGVDINGHEVIASPDGQFAYVPIYGNSGVGKPGTDGSTVEVIDIAAGRAVHIIDLGKPTRPHCAKFGPDGLLYVSAELAKAVDVIDPRTRKLLAELPTGQMDSHMLVLSPDGSRVYTANVFAGNISVVDVPDRKRPCGLLRDFGRAVEERHRVRPSRNCQEHRASARDQAVVGGASERRQDRVHGAMVARGAAGIIPAKEPRP